MDYTRPDIVSGTTKLDKPFFENLFDGIDDRPTREEANDTYAPIRSTGSVLPKGTLARRYEKPIRLAVFSDSRGEGVTPNPATEGITGWDKTFPSLVAQMMRNELGTDP